MNSKEQKNKYPSENCDASCYYHCTKNGQQEPECIVIKNNGWIKIESEDDLPKLGRDFWGGKLFDNGKFMQLSYILSKDSISEHFKNRIITHYQPIEKPKPPLY